MHKHGFIVAAPSTPPRDLTAIPLDDHRSMVTLSWQPPRFPNGQITGEWQTNGSNDSVLKRWQLSALSVVVI